MKIIRWFWENILFVSTLFLLVVIPLYPKRPLFDVVHTWVYIRIEDFVVVFVIFAWFVLFLRKKATLQTPLTAVILLYWIIGGIATIHGVLLIFPTLSDVFSNVAFLSFLRRIEYLSLFFVAYSGMKDKKFVSSVAVVLAFVLFAVVGYGFGQKYLGFPAYLTMNEEFAKGNPIQLSELSRVPSTFAGQYDLAAYLVLTIPLLVSLAFGFKNWFMRIFLLLASSFGFVLLFMTVSRVSFFVLLLSLGLLLIVQKKRLVILSFFLLTILLLIFSPSLLNRFGNTVLEIDVLVDAKTGNAIGKVIQVPASYFKNKTVLKQSASHEDAKLASSSAIFPFSLIPQQAALVLEPNSPNGENLPQGTSYINLPLSPISKKLGIYFYQKSEEHAGVESTDVRVFHGDFIIKRAKAYDLSFTTRFQGEWPRTLLAFERNIFLGSGFGSVSLAVDNDYLRLLGETGLFGFVSFLSIFLVAGIYVKKILPKVDSKLSRSFVLGFVAGTFGLGLNAILIDVFEASKIAFVYWLLMGIAIGILNFYKEGQINIYKEFKTIATSSLAIVLYLFIAAFALFWGISNLYFVGDDFTWLRWIASCGHCGPIETIIRYFTQANGFFYRPGTKLYFDFMYSAFWLNQGMYHVVSLLAHFIAAVLIFLISQKILKDTALSAGSAVLFLILSGHLEAIFWVSSTGFLFTAVFALLCLLFFISWREKKRKIYFVASVLCVVLSLLFHELGVVVPFLVILYEVVFGKHLHASLKKIYYFILLFPILPYVLLRALAGSHWFNGDYSYNLLKLPYNIIGNSIGYGALGLFGPSFLPFYEVIRTFSREHPALAVVGLLLVLFLLVLFCRSIIKGLTSEEKRIVIFGFLFFILSLLPFLGLGNIASRYSYLSSFGLVLLMVFFLQKIYTFLLGSGRYTALLATIAIVIVFCTVHLFQLQKIQTDWEASGEKSKNALVSLDSIYAHYPQEATQRLYFVDVPIRNGDAWVFPVGLSDAVWFVFQRQEVLVYQKQSLSQAFEEVGNSKDARVLKFNDDGSLLEMKKTQSGTIVPVEF